MSSLLAAFYGVVQEPLRNPLKKWQTKVPTVLKKTSGHLILQIKQTGVFLHDFVFASYRSSRTSPRWYGKLPANAVHRKDGALFPPAAAFSLAGRTDMAICDNSSLIRFNSLFQRAQYLSVESSCKIEAWNRFPRSGSSNTE